MNLFGKKEKEKENFISLDLGSNSIKVMELELREGERPKLVNIATCPTPRGIFTGNEITQPKIVAEAISNLFTVNDISCNKVVFAVPASSTFTKKLSMRPMDDEELSENIAFEARNYIPERIDGVTLDCQVLSRTNNAMEVLLVAVKKPVLNSYVRAIAESGLEPVIADIDFFALENMFEVNYRDEQDKTVALVNIGYKYSVINIIDKGKSVFTGDMNIGGKLFNDALCDGLGLKTEQAEQVKRGKKPKDIDKEAVGQAMEKVIDEMSSELRRQIEFFWSASPTDNPVESIFLSGGASCAKGLMSKLEELTEINCELINCFREISWQEGFEESYLNDISPSFALSMGLAIRRFGDKQNAPVQKG